LASIALYEIAFQNIDRTDCCFNWPVDTVYRFFDTSKDAFKPVDKSNYVKDVLGFQEI
jgi:signal peptidase I